MIRPILEVVDLSMRFGGLLAVDGIGLTVAPEQIVAVIGPNGAGKTTVFNCISGFYAPTTGRILLDDQPVHGLPSHQVARAGLVRTFQNLRLFRQLTVLENLLVAQHMHLPPFSWAGLLNLAGYRRAERAAIDRALLWLERVGLAGLANREAGTLAYGQQRRLEIARCMITQPKVLLLDEPAAGLNPHETAELKQLILGLRNDFDLAVLLIEHDMHLVMGISDHILVMEYGRPLAAGVPDDIRQDPRVIKAYLGEE